jgi:hypothetical protein
MRQSAFAAPTGNEIPEKTTVLLPPYQNKQIVITRDAEEGTVMNVRWCGPDVLVYQVGYSEPVDSPPAEHGIYWVEMTDPKPEKLPLGRRAVPGRCSESGDWLNYYIPPEAPNQGDYWRYNRRTHEKQSVTPVPESDELSEGATLYLRQEQAPHDIRLRQAKMDINKRIYGFIEQFVHSPKGLAYSYKFVRCAVMNEVARCDELLPGVRIRYPAYGVSRDGNTLVFREESNNCLWVYRVDNKMKQCVAKSFINPGFWISPDGKWLAFDYFAKYHPSHVTYKMDHKLIAIRLFIY